MSVIVKGMDMPTNCRDCIFCHFYSISGYTKCDIGLKVLAYDYKPILFDGKPNWCPLIEIPKCARLIDGKELKAKIIKWMPPDPCGVEEKEFPFETDICVSTLMEIDEAPVIFEEGDE